MRALFAVAMAGVVCGVVASAAAAQDPERIPVWSGWAEDGSGGAADCTGCFESEYVLMSCTRGSDEVRVELIGLLVPEDGAGRLPVTVEVDGIAQTWQSEFERSEMFGPVPVLSPRLGDPLFERLREGTTLTLVTEGDRLDIPLAGVKAALDTMLAACR